MPSNKINLNELRKLVEQVISESDFSQQVEITITKNDPDERAPEKNSPPTYSVDYVIGEELNMLQFTGTLKPYHTGRDTEYEFEPSWFQDDESEEYYSDNWEEIEEQILNKLYSGETLSENEMPDMETHSAESIDGKYASKKSIINAVYDVLKKAKVEGIYNDQYWIGVKKLTNALSGADIDYTLQKSNYTGHQSLYSDSSLPTKKEYKFFLKIHDKEGKEVHLPLKVVCAFVGKTGTMEDDQYELTYVIEA